MEPIPSRTNAHATAPAGPDHGAVHGAWRVRQHCAMNRPHRCPPAHASRASAQEKNATLAARATLRALATRSAPATRWSQTFFHAEAARCPGPIRTNSVSLCLALSRYISLCLTSRLALSHLASRFVSEYLGISRNISAFPANKQSCLTDIRRRHSRLFIIRSMRNGEAGARRTIRFRHPAAGGPETSRAGATSAPCRWR